MYCAFLLCSYLAMQGPECRGEVYTKAAYVYLARLGAVMAKARCNIGILVMTINQTVGSVCTLSWETVDLSAGLYKCYY